MAKKKKSSESKKKFRYTNELTGLVLILFCITGLGSFGAVGNLVKKFAIFLFGTWYFILLILGLCYGVYLLAKRSKPDFFSARLVGVYAIILSLLLFSHINYIKDTNVKGKEIFTTTFDNISASYNVESEIRNTGGGMIGATTSWAFVSLFDVEGTTFVLVIIAGFGLIMLFDVTLVDIFKAIISPFKKLFDRSEKDEEEKISKKQVLNTNDIIEDETPIDKRVVITSVEDLEPKKDATVGNIETSKMPEPVEEETTNEVYIKPPVALLNINKSKGKVNSTEFIASNTKILERVFSDFGMRAKVIEVHVGPAVTQYEMDLDRGTKVNKVLSISREIALALAAKEVRIEAPIPGKNTIGVEIPNQTIMAVSMREIMEDLEKNPKYKDSKLAAPLGRDIMGKVKCVEINKTPHMLVAGATGSGKSVCINCIIASILMRTKPDEVKLVMVDPKKVELSMYNGVPHLLTPVVTDPKKASIALKNIVVEMERRYQVFEDTKCKNISSYNKMCETNTDYVKMPYIVFIIDELADLMLVAAKDVEDSIMRITQMARAAGIHLIVATQRPSTDVITGVVKANIPSRISFAVSSSIDSRTILDQTGAEKLLGKGDMLFKPMGENVPIRIQGAYVSDEELQKIVDFTISQQKANYDHSITEERGGEGTDAGKYDDGYESKEEYDDPLYNDIVDFAMEFGKISASLIQRKYRIGYNRAARIVDLLEERGIIGPQNGSKPREVLVKKETNTEEE